MSGLSWKEIIAVAQTDGSALASSTSETTLLPAAAKVTLLQDYFDKLGKTLFVHATGRMSTVVTTPGTMTFRFKLGSAAVFNSGAIALNVTAQTNAAWDLWLKLVLRSIGSGTSATILGVGRFSSRALIGSAAAAAGGVGVIVLPDTAPAVGTGFDSTIANQSDLTAQWSVNNAANSIQLHQYSLIAGN